MSTKSKKIVLGVVAALVALIAILGVTAPTQMRVEESITINRPTDQVFLYLRDLKKGEEWSPWFKVDPNMTSDYSGRDGQVGSKVAWSGNREVGKGEMEITNIVDNQRIDYALHFKEPMEGESTSWFTTTPNGTGATTVTWGMDSPMPFPMNIVGALMNCKGMISDLYKQGLSDLKATLEK